MGSAEDDPEAWFGNLGFWDSGWWGSGCWGPLGGSWVVICGVISPPIWVITAVSLLITPQKQPMNLQAGFWGLGLWGDAGLWGLGFSLVLIRFQVAGSCVPQGEFRRGLLGFRIPFSSSCT